MPALTIGRGGLSPIVVLGALFAWMGMRSGFQLGTSAVVGAVGGTSSLLAHELGHVRAARRTPGVHPVGVSLEWGGAATRLEGAYASGHDRMKVALAGPGASFAVALGLLPFLALPLPAAYRGLLLLLVVFNVGLAVVNLVPARPLDGYNALVGALWAVLGSEGSARRLLGRVATWWLVLELAATALLLVERPAVGLLALTLGIALLAQSRLARVASFADRRSALSER